MPEFPRTLHHHTPEWVESDAVFHIRLRAQTISSADSLTTESVGHGLLEAAKRYHDWGHWRCDLLLLMPDHLHALLGFRDAAELAVVVRNWKRGTARFQGVHWQSNFFDHRLRSRKEGEETWHYILRNPVAKGLCANEADWPWSWSGTLAGGTPGGGAQ
jgi:REP element-mobilizing transposase RayT